ncbi:MAG: DUF4118 domain-containing protein [Ramlibacter sp.]|nr:DUF4118 domain-containing protein [Ramlibacter sp.]
MFTEFTGRPTTRSAATLSAVGLLGLATLLAFCLDSQVSLTSLAMVYLLAVVVAAYLLDWVASAATAVAAVTALNFLFVPPRWTFEVESRDHLIALSAMLVVSLVISHLARGLRREAALARLNEQRAQQLQWLATELGAAQTPQEVCELGRRALLQAFAGPVLLVGLDPDGSMQTETSVPSLVRQGLQQCVKENAILGPGTGRWPGLNAWYLPMGNAEETLGVVQVQPARAGDNEGRLHAAALVALLGQALLRLRLNRAVLAAQGEAQRQHLLNTFLAAISHDLRTPLAAITGAATSLQTQGERLSHASRERLMGSIVSEATYLNTLAENTLHLTRLTSQKTMLPLQWESLEELVGTAVARIRQRDPDRRISTRVQPGLPLVRAEPVLMGRLLANLLDNALHYSDGPVEVTAQAGPAELSLCVKDRGRGLTEELKARLFLPFSRGDHTGLRGAGLGLAVCHAIASAHGGRLSARNRKGGGAAFCLTLTLEPQPDLSEAMP